MQTLKKQEKSSSSVDPLAYLAHFVQHQISTHGAPQDGHVARQCKEKKQEKDSQYFEDKVLLMKAKERGEVLDAEAEAF
nr:hypothetical protein [Tanacetum cinerariifolium]